MVKIDQKTTGELKELLGKLGIEEGRVVVDFKMQTIGCEKAGNVNDYLVRKGYYTREQLEEMDRGRKKLLAEWGF